MQSTARASVPLRAGIVLGLLSVLGPVAIDLYLPAFPQIAEDLAASPGEVQRTLSIFFFALAAAQIPIGSLGDRAGRKVPLCIGLLVFVIASLFCGIASSADQLVLWRFVQGAGACAGTAVARAMIRDQYSGHEAARLMALTFLVIGLSPVLAPLAGSLLLDLLSWRWLFAVMAGAGAIALMLSVSLLPETLPPARRTPWSQPIWSAYRALLGNWVFLGAAVIAGLATTVPFAFLTAAPFVYVEQFGLTPKAYSLLLAANAVVSIVATQFSPGLMRRWGARRLLLRVAAVGVVLSVLLLVLIWAGWLQLALFQCYSMALFALVGLALTPAAITAIDVGARHAGAAAGALGTLQLVVTGAVSWLISVLSTGSAAALATTLLGCLALAGLLALMTLRGIKQAD
ncbi:MAG: multidrug effflux MFS transporter [Spongiibacteraceae bacterium]|jgi:DHA1 family bicyclomycin/chloramphenicol resistance-like MFS transporter|nr:multidrug effflux MFS transporter [Spongiibacteraceae bacterium]